MRTTLDIDDDILNAARERAKREHKTIGQIVSELLREALTGLRSSSQVGEVAKSTDFSRSPRRAIWSPTS